MHLLYLDDSGSANDSDQAYFVLGGVSVFEAQVYFLNSQLDQLASQIETANPHSLEFHASDIYQGREVIGDYWKTWTREKRRNVISSVFKIFNDAYSTTTAFACAIHKPSFPDEDPVERAFEDLCSRFDQHLKNLSEGADKQRGLIILDKSSYETSLQKLSRDFRRYGTRWNSIQNLAETPLFLDSKASRLIQLADHIAYSVFRRYEVSDTWMFDQIVSRIKQKDGVLHGLAHLQKTDKNCMCPACLSRRQDAN